MKLLLRLKLIGLFLFVSNVSAKEIIIEPGPNAYDEVQEAMILMDEGDTLILKSGNYWFEGGLSLDVANVTIQGDGMDETILNFERQVSGAQGLLVLSLIHI